jgi:glycosyltransferase involved in cell wall biosynthesis
MKILYVITKSEIGGAQTHVLQLAKYMADKNDDVAVMAYPGGWLEKIFNSQFLISNQFSISNFQTKDQIKFYPNRYFKNSYSPFLGIKAMAEVKKAVKDFKPDIVHCHSSAAGFWARLALRSFTPRPACNAVALRAGKLGVQYDGLAVIFTAHGWFFTEGAGLVRRIIGIIAEKFAGKFCKKIICVSEYDKQLAIKYKIAAEKKLEVIHNGVEVMPRKNAEFYAEKRGNKKCKIVFVGRLSKPKDPELLLEAYFQLITDNQQPTTNNQQLIIDTELLIVGDGPKRKNLELRIKNYASESKIKLLGSLAREKVFEVLQQSDIFVLTSNWEGFPITILEAMSCGLPIIASDVGGVKEAVDEEVGYLIKRGDKEALKKALIELIENPELAKKKGENARKRVEQEFSLEKMLQETERMYNSITNKSH